MLDENSGALEHCGSNALHPYATVLARCLHLTYLKVEIPPGQNLKYVVHHGVRLTDLVEAVNEYQRQWQLSCSPTSFVVGTGVVLEETVDLEQPTKGPKQQALAWFSETLLIGEILSVEKYYLSTKGPLEGIYYGIVKR